VFSAVVHEEVLATTPPELDNLKKDKWKSMQVMSFLMCQVLAYDSCG
jgi:hypothetical protein